MKKETIRKKGVDFSMMRVLKIMSFVFILLFIPAMVAAVDIDSCQTISSPGSYELNQSIDANTSCFDINANNVVFDCQGYYINGSESNLSDSAIYGIIVNNNDNVTIQNCPISWWYTGIRQYAGSDDMTIYNNTFSGNFTYAFRGSNGNYNLTFDSNNITIDAGYSFYMSNVNGWVNVTNNYVSGTGGTIYAYDGVGPWYVANNNMTGTGLALRGDNIIAEYNTVTDSLAGAQVLYADNVTIQHNTFYNVTKGVYDWTGNTNIEIWNNTMTGGYPGAFAYGIWAQGQNNINHSIHDNEITGFASGIQSWSTSYAEYYNNYIHDNSGPGIGISAYPAQPALNISIHDNIIDNNAGTGIGVDTAYNSSIYNNNITTTTSNGVGLSDTGNVDIWNNRILHAGLYGMHINSSVTDTNAYNNYIYNTTNDGVRTNGTTYNVNLYNNELDLIGSDGFLLSGTINGTWNNNTITNTTGYCFNIIGGTGNDIENNTMINCGSHGMYVTSASAVETISYNNITYSGDDGINFGGDDSFITYNYICFNSGDGLELTSDAENNTVEHNEFCNQTLNNTKDDGTDDTYYQNTFDDFVPGSPYSIPGTALNSDPYPNPDFDDDGDGYDHLLDCDDGNATIRPLTNSTTNYIWNDAVICPGNYTNALIYVNGTDTHVMCNKTIDINNYADTDLSHYPVWLTYTTTSNSVNLYKTNTAIDGCFINSTVASSGGFSIFSNGAYNSHNVTNCYIEGNNYRANGIALDGSSGNYIMDNYIRAHSSAGVIGGVTSRYWRNTIESTYLNSIGFSLGGVSFAFVDNNTISTSNHGISASGTQLDASGNNITCYDTGGLVTYGIRSANPGSSKYYGDIDNNNIIGCDYGINLYESTAGQYGNVTNNTVTNSTVAGIWLYGVGDATQSVLIDNNIQMANTTSDVAILVEGPFASSTNWLIYNNIFNGTVNESSGGTNYWNTTLQAGSNILNGGSIGGNFYANYTGYDTDEDGVGNTPFTLPGTKGAIDYLPLTNEDVVPGSGGAGWSLGGEINETEVETDIEYPTDEEPKTIYSWVMNVGENFISKFGLDLTVPNLLWLIGLGLLAWLILDMDNNKKR